MNRLGITIVAVGSLGIFGCGDDDGGGGACLEPGGDDQRTVQRALIEASSGDTVCFGAGTFSFTDELSLEVNDVTLRGADGGGTILDFTMQMAGANGLRIAGDGVTVEGLTVQNTQGDGIRADAVAGITFRNVVVRWDGEPDEDNGAYGLYPVSSTDVLIEDCEVFGARDAGIYVGQSENIVVRGSLAHGNVAGIEIENSVNADVYDNDATDNTGGILVFDLPNLPAGNGGGVLVRDNRIFENNRVNFAAIGTIVSYVPTGTGVMVLATDRVEVRNNEIRDNDGTGVVIISWLTVSSLGVGGEGEPTYDEWPETNYIHDNTFMGNGTNPMGLLTMFDASPLEDIIWDGVVDPMKDNSDGSLSLCIQDNGTATFRNFDFDPMDPGGMTMPTTDLAPHDCMHMEQPGVTL